jgi:branched-chain amino acid transport system ATP-binding protein
MLFRLSDLTVHYQKVAALKGVSLALEDGDIVTLIGANGAGKSTTLRAISGLVRPSAGEIWFDGRRIDRLKPEQIVALGIAHVPEGRRVFPDLTAPARQDPLWRRAADAGDGTRADGPAAASSAR